MTRVLREHLGNVNCRAVMIAHVSRDVAHYSDTLSTVQMASRIHRVLKKKTKVRKNYIVGKLIVSISATQSQTKYKIQQTVMHH